MIRGVYLVLDPDATGGRPASRIARDALSAGASAIQWRQKVGSIRARWEEMQEIHALCRQHQVPFLINDRVDVAIALDADGAHVGQDDLPATAARSLLLDRMLGVSITAVEQVAAAEEAGADYLGVGPIYPTRSKEDAATAGGLALLRSVRESTSLPIVAIGGIQAENAAAVRAAGADAVAVISAICNAPNAGEATAGLIAGMEADA